MRAACQEWAFRVSVRHMGPNLFARRQVACQETSLCESVTAETVHANSSAASVKARSYLVLNCLFERSESSVAFAARLSEGQTTVFLLV